MDRDALASDLERMRVQATAAESSSNAAAAATVYLRSQRGRDSLTDSTFVNTLGEGEWEKLQQVHVLANVHQAFDLAPAPAAPPPAVASSASAASPSSPASVVAASSAQATAGGAGPLYGMDSGMTTPVPMLTTPVSSVRMRELCLFAAFYSLPLRCRIRMQRTPMRTRWP